VQDPLGKNFTMELTEACPELAKASTFSLVTDSFKLRSTLWASQSLAGSVRSGIESGRWICR
jgi:hypothetical protein